MAGVVKGHAFNHDAVPRKLVICILQIIQIYFVYVFTACHFILDWQYFILKFGCKISPFMCKLYKPISIVNKDLNLKVMIKCRCIAVV